MASDNEASCESDPNFAVICAFMEKFGATCGLASIDFLELQEMLENTQEVPQELIDLHIKLLRKSRKTVSNERWEKAIIKFCHTFCVQDAWEIERFGYKKARLSSKLRVLKELLEMQFDYNARFKAEINKMSAEELRSQPLGKDKQGHAYWFQNDNNCQIRVYKEDPDEETWILVAKDRDGLAALIDELSNGDADSKAIAESILNEEDSNSLVEKPIIDTGQVDSSSSESNKKSAEESENSNESKKEDNNISPPEGENGEEEEDERKRTRESDEEEMETKRAKLEVGDEIEEPMMLVKGMGNGVENQCENPIVGEEIEEDLMYFYGSGNGADCETGNEDETKKTEDNGSGGNSSAAPPSGGDSENCVSIIVDTKNCIDEDGVDGAAPREVPTSPVKSPFKLGTIIDTKTDNKFFNAGKNPTKKSSRWDVETIIAKEPPPPEATPKKSMFFFGPGCLQFKPSVSPVACSATVAFGQKVPQTDTADDEEKLCVDDGQTTEETNDVGYRIGDGEESVVEASECVQSSEPVGPTRNDAVSDEKVEGTLLVDQQTPLESSIENKLEDIEDKNDETKANKEDVDRQSVLVTEEEKIEEQQEASSDSKDNTEEVTKISEPEEKEVATTKIVEEQVEESPEKTVEEVNKESVAEEQTTNTKEQVEKEEILAEATKSAEEEDKTEQILIETKENTEVENIEKSLEPSENTEEDKTEEQTESVEEENSEKLTSNVEEEEKVSLPLTEISETEQEVLVAPAENTEDKVQDEILSERAEKVEEEKKDCSVEIASSTEEKREQDLIEEKKKEDLIEEKEKADLIVEEGKDNLLEEEKVEEDNKILTKDKNENFSSKESEEQTENIQVDQSKPQLEPEVTSLSNLEKEIVTDEEVHDFKSEHDIKIPEVTAALVECEPKLEENLEASNLTNDSCTESKKEEEEKEPELVPVIEEECVKKHSYLLGEETEKNETENDCSVEKTEDTLVETTNLKQSEESQTQENIPEIQEPAVKPCDTSADENSIVDKDKIDNQQQTEEKLNCTAAKEKLVDENQETVICSVKNEVEHDNKNLEEPPVLLEEVTKKEEEQMVKEPANNNKRGRKNNVSDQPKMITRRSTRSSRSEESKVVDEKTNEPTDLSIVKEEKKPELSPKPEESQAAVQPRRGRSRGMAKVEKEEVSEVDNSKKIKLSDEVREEVTEVKPSKQTKNKVKDNQEEKNAEEVKEEQVKPEASPEVVTVESGNSSDLADVPDKDPLAVSEEEIAVKENEEKPPMSLTSFSLDFHESPAPTPPLTRSGLRKRGRESPPNAEDVEETAGKRLKKGKRNIDVKLRKSIEEQKKQELISSDDDKQQQVEEAKNSKKKGNKHKKAEAVKNEESVMVSSDAEPEAPKETEPAQKKSKTVNKNKRLLSNLGINPDQPLEFQEQTTVGVRQSRRIAQLKIKEEAERRKLEEEMAQELQEKKKKKSKKSEDKEYKVKKSKHDADDDEDVQGEDSTDSKKRKKKKKKKHKKLFDEFNPWRSSSDSSTTDDEEEEDEIVEEEDDEVLQYVSDHEFSPESDLEADGEAQPLKRARTARKESDVEEVDDCPCQKCGKSDHPEWILLCDRCDNGWHCSCLRPPLLVIPEGDWFCPPCQHGTLLRRLQEKLKDYDKKLSKKEIEDRRKQRLAYVGISLNNVLPAKETETLKKRRLSNKEEDDEEGDDDDAEDDDVDEEDEEDEEESEESGSASGSESGSESDEPIYQLRQRRQAQTYRFNDYDELINSAIQEEMDAVKGAGNQGRGKDIATIVNAEKEEERKKETENGTVEEVAPDEAEDPEPLPPVVPPDDRDKEAKPLYSDDEPVVGVKKKIVGRKKHRKLNSLDISSADDDEDSDEDFKGTSSESEDDFDEDLGSEDSEDLDSGRGRRRNADPVRRSTRARTSRYDADFIDDGDSEDEDEAPRRKKKRSIWDESESEESDRSWGRRKRKPPANRKKTTTTSLSTKKKKSKKKKKKNDDSDAEVYRKKKPKIKFGMEGEDEGPGRRTRGKKINYVDALGSDSDEDRVKRPPPRIESEEEYVANEDDELDEDDKVTDEEESGEENSVIKSTAPKVQIQSYADARFTQLLPEGVPTPKELYVNNQVIRDEDCEDEPNAIDQINRNVEMMDENEMEKMMEEEEYANKQLQMVAIQLEKEKRRKEREAKKLEGLVAQPSSVVVQNAAAIQQLDAKKRVVRKPPIKGPFQFSGPMQEPIVGNVDNLIVNAENNDELSEPPGVSLPLFAELGGPGVENLEDPAKKRRARSKKSLEEAVASLGTVRQQQETGFLTMGTNNNKNLPTDLSANQDSNIEIAAPPQPFSQSQPTPSVITRMLQSKPGQPGYPVGTIRPKQFASLSEREDEVQSPTSAPPVTHHSMSPAPAHHGQFLPGAPMRPQLASPYRQLPPTINHYPRVGGAPPPAVPHQIRNPVPPPPHMYHSHRPMDPSPSGGGAISIADHHNNSPGRVVSPASSSPGGTGNKNETPPPPYSRPPPVSRFPMINTTSAAGPRHIPMVAPQHLQAPRPNLSPYHPSMPPSYHYGQFGGQPLGGTEDAMPPTVYQNSPYSEPFEGQVNPSENSNSKSFDDESGGEFGGLVSYFSSQREDDLES